ncbi:hypothetical protein SAMN05428642_10436 [Flaviramulus basaltis]|uniref:Bacteriorhodopsin n=1 Tax=Flaviramulus basaltis TaxID=369401 RepID=A0A1K2IPA1_9FLAO|nr:hypothetical protein SAMN05428642_10436 [Flaviramulus basaltis]
MNDFLIKYYSLLTHSVEILSAVTGVILYKKYKHTPAKYFIYFLIYIGICDFLGIYTYYIKNNGFLSFLEGTPFERNYWWSGLYWKVGAVVFFAFYYNKILQNTKFKSIIEYTAYTFLLFSICYIIINFDAFFISSLRVLNIFGALIIFLCTFLYFTEILLSDRILKVFKSLNFYISVTIFIWWLVITPLVFFEIYNSTSDWNFVFLKWQIFLFLNIFMYITFTFALICCKPQND